jgi:hypothetical protein
MPEESTIQIPGTKTRVPRAAVIGAAVVGVIALVVIVGRKGGGTSEEESQVVEEGIGAGGDEDMEDLEEIIQEEYGLETPGFLEPPPLPDYAPGDYSGYQIPTLGLGLPKSSGGNGGLKTGGLKLPTPPPSTGGTKTSPKPSTPPPTTGGSKTTIKPLIPPPTTGGLK